MNLQNNDNPQIIDLLSIQIFQTNLKQKYNALWKILHSLTNLQSFDFIKKTINTVFEELDKINGEIYDMYKQSLIHDSKIIISSSGSSNMIVQPELQNLSSHLKPPCFCRNNAEKILFGLLNNNMENIKQIDDIAGFFRVFHNEINLKLDKEIFINYF